ncbi:hypothetical protein DXV75_13825 [Alteromonas aestuariivivens]|uniref:Activator of Hsp90 ATPase homologue 1/2-like C-terminal domain-containing protein n=1 Tax=Alteromonas aestuariivivens TaxID=1938339 RepID=A0A3D8M4B7_9ALTE|nr:SRPBCC domain-containing protein [Alteromonas aestuariivivens]RDV24496.1 hypothetical protein DXV75_13825 [Alteromonas aestuariivivens]
MSESILIDAIEQTRTFNQPIARVWAAISDPKQVAQWFGERAEYQLVAGSIGYFEWVNTDCAGKYAMRVEKVQAPNYFAWRWMNDTNVPFEINGSTLVEFILTEEGESTELLVRETGFASQKHWQMNTQGWQNELAELVAWLS